MYNFSPIFKRCGLWRHAPHKYMYKLHWAGKNNFPGDNGVFLSSCVIIFPFLGIFIYAFSIYLIYLFVYLVLDRGIFTVPVVIFISFTLIFIIYWFFIIFLIFYCLFSTGAGHDSLFSIIDVNQIFSTYITSKHIDLAHLPWGLCS